MGSNGPRTFCYIHRSTVALDLLIAILFSSEFLVKNEVVKKNGVEGPADILLYSPVDSNA